MKDGSIVELCGMPRKVGLCGCQGRLGFEGVNKDWALAFLVCFARLHVMIDE